MRWRRGTRLIDVKGVAKHYGAGETRVDALRSVDLQVRAGEVIAPLGPSGSGKTTLLNIIGCILAPTAGQLALDGETVFDGRWLRDDLRRLRLDKIGFIFQVHNLLPFLTASENVALVLDLAGAPQPCARPGHANCWTISRSATAPGKSRRICRAARRSGWPLRGRWRTDPGSSWQMSRPPLWTASGRNW